MPYDEEELVNVRGLKQTVNRTATLSLASLTHETWIFELEDGTTVEKEIPIWISAA